MNNRERSIDEATLLRLGERTFDQLTIAIETDKTEQVLELATRMHAELVAMRDLYINWASFLFTFIHKNYGDDNVETAKKELLQYCAGSDPEYGPAYAGMSDEERVQLVATISVSGAAQEKATDQVALDQLTRAINTGETSQVLELATRIHDELFGMHGLYLVWIACLFTFIGKHYGNEDAERAMEELMHNSFNRNPELGPTYERMSDRERLEAIAAAHRGHSYPFGVREKEDCYEFVIEECGSGGRLIQRGVYEGPDALYKIKGPSPMTYGQAECPAYCTHCYFNSAIIPKGSNEPLLGFTAADKLGYGTCIVRVPKKESKQHSKQKA